MAASSNRRCGGGDKRQGTLEFSKRALFCGSRQNRTEMLMHLAQIIDFRPCGCKNLK